MVLRLCGRGGSSKVYETLDQENKVNMYYYWYIYFYNIYALGYYNMHV